MLINTEKTKSLVIVNSNKTHDVERQRNLTSKDI